MNDAPTNNQKRTTPTDEQIDLEVMPIISDEEPRDLYRKNGGDSDHFRRDQVVAMLRKAYKTGWNGAIETITLPALFSKPDKGSDHGR